MIRNIEDKGVRAENGIEVENNQEEKCYCRQRDKPDNQSHCSRLKLFGLFIQKKMEVRYE